MNFRVDVFGPPCLPIFFLCAVLLSVPSAAEEYEYREVGISGTITSSVLDHDRIALVPYLWNMRNFVPTDPKSLEQIYERKDPLQVFHAVFLLMMEHRRTGDVRVLKQALAGVDFMLGQYEPRERIGAGIRWFYGHDFKEMKAPWWSGMDAFFGPLVVYAAYEITGDIRYRDVALASAKLALKTPMEGGSFWHDTGGCWISAFAWSGMSLDDELFVLNGHMWGLQALYMLSRSSDDNELRDAYTCARNGAEARANQFLTKGGIWTWYQLNPGVISPVHYNLLEMAQFRAMYAMTNDSLYKKIEDQRVAAFKNAYPVELFDNGKQVSAIFSLVGPPHPFWTDTYPVTIECQGKDKSVKSMQSRQYSNDPYDKRFFAVVDMHGYPNSCSISIRSGVDVPVYRVENLSVVGDETGRGEIDATPTVSLDARGFSNDAVSIVPEHEEIPGHSSYLNIEARIKFNIPLSYDDKDILALVLLPENDLKIALLMEDDNGNRISRYYPTLKKGVKNIVLLHRLGFEGNDEMAGRPSHLTVRVFTDGLQSPFSVRVVDYSLVKNALGLRSYFSRQGDAYFSQQ